MPRVVFYVPFNATENSLAPVVLGLYVQLVPSPLALNGDGEGQENSLKHPKISKAFIKSSTNSDRKFRDKNTLGIIFYYRITA